MVNGELHATWNTDRQPDTQVSVFSLANFRIFRNIMHLSNNMSRQYVMYVGMAGRRTSRV